MASSVPFAQLVGAVEFYIAQVGTAEPALYDNPVDGGWVSLGCTEGEQSFESMGPITYFYDNCHQGPVKAVRPQEDFKVNGILVDMTLEKVMVTMGNAGNVPSTGSDANSTAFKRVPIIKGFIPSEWALLARGNADSPYGAFPGQWYIPRGLFEGEFTRTRGKTVRDNVAFIFAALEDDNQTDGNGLGWLTVAIEEANT
jgi:hypothetical protein